jgi:hypothetical protein
MSLRAQAFDSGPWLPLARIRQTIARCVVGLVRFVHVDKVDMRHRLPVIQQDGLSQPPFTRTNKTGETTEVS